MRSRRVCPTPGCPNLTAGGRCPTCQAKADKIRGSRQQRGYDRAHETTRRRLLPHAYGRPCPLCHEPMLPGQPLDLDHTIPLAVDKRSRGDRITHAHCNRGRRPAR